MWGFTLRLGGSGEDRASEAKGTSLASSGQREKAHRGRGERPPGHAEPCRVGEEFLVHHTLTRRHRRIWDGRDVIRFVFKKTALAAVYERPRVVKGKEERGTRAGTQGRRTVPRARQKLWREREADGLGMCLEVQLLGLAEGSDVEGEGARGRHCQLTSDAGAQNLRLTC